MMAVDYYIYSAETGECISTERYAGLPFLWKEASDIGQEISVKWEREKYLDKICSFDFKKQSLEQEDIAIYYDKQDINKLQQLMSTNKDILSRLMNENDCEGMVVVIC